MAEKISFSNLKATAREQLKGKQTEAALVCLAQLGVHLLCTVSMFLPLFFACGPLAIGSAEYFYSLTEAKPTKVGTLFNGFNNYSRNLLVSLSKAGLVCLWGLLLIVPGIIVGLRYAQTNFIAANYPDRKVRQILGESAELMRGKKWELFLLQLSFLGWFALSIFTLGILLLWIIPYYRTTMANYYKKITEKANTL